MSQLQQSQPEISLSEEQLATLGIVFVSASVVQSIMPYPVTALLFPALTTFWFFESGHRIPVLEQGYHTFRSIADGPMGRAKDRVINAYTTWSKGSKAKLSIEEQPAEPVPKPEDAPKKWFQAFRSVSAQTESEGIEHEDEPEDQDDEEQDNSETSPVRRPTTPEDYTF